MYASQKIRTFSCIIIILSKAGGFEMSPEFPLYEKKIQVRCSTHLPTLFFNLKQFFNLSLSFMTLTFWVNYFIKYPSIVVFVLSFMIKFKDCIYRLNSLEELCFSQCILIKALMMPVCPTTVDLNLITQLRWWLPDFSTVKLLFSTL